MFIPSHHSVALLFMFITMLCWGSWANTQKLAKGWRFELFYWDYAFGVLLASLAYLFVLGCSPIQSAWSDLAQYRNDAFLHAFLGGVIFNAANLLLVAAIAYAGMAVAFPVGIGIALVFGTLLSYLVHPAGSVSLLICGIVAILYAIFLDARAYRRLSHGNNLHSKKGLWIAIVSGILMGTFYPLVAKSMHGEGALNIYLANVIFSLGVFLGNIPMNIALMKKPFSGSPLTCADYRQGSKQNHVLGILGGVIWSTGMTFNLIAANVAGPAIAYAFGQGATLVAAIWGVFVWREFKDAQSVNGLLKFMFVSYIIGLYLIGIAR